jgi:hypothetical protein
MQVSSQLHALAALPLWNVLPVRIVYENARAADPTEKNILPLIGIEP